MNMYSEIFSVQEQLLKAIAHSRRLEIIQLLRNQELSVNSIHQMLDLPQANISQHLTILRDAGVVVTKRVGKQIFYALADLRILLACDELRNFLIDQPQYVYIKNELQLPMHQLVPVVNDPVCGMRLSPKTANFSHHYQGKKYYFCASGCKKEFSRKPSAYITRIKIK